MDPRLADVTKAVGLGVSPIAKNLAGSTGPETLGKQVIAVHEYIKRRWPSEYQGMLGGDYETMRNAAKGTWFGLGREGGAVASAEWGGHGSLLADAQRSGAMGAPMTHKVSGEANLNVRLGPGLVPGGVPKTTGHLFSSVKVHRGGTRYADH
jgi:hypothetical protein